MTYPLGLRLRGRRAVVVGGGATAARIAADLLAARADVLVVAPVLDAALAELAAGGLVTMVRRDVVPADLDGAWLVLACADQPGVNAAIAREAERNRIWCVAAGDDASSSALLPAGGRADFAARADSAAEAAGAASGPGRRVLVLGGARSGKSAAAEAMLARACAVDYVATGQLPGDGDQEWDQRVRAHQDRRPGHWATVETLDVEQVLACLDGASPERAGPEGRAVLVDCISTWLARVMDDCGVWDGRPGAESELTRRTDGLVAAWRLTRRQAVAVSNEVGSGVVPATPSGRRFRDELGWLNSRIAAESDEVWLCTAGIAQRLR